MNPARLAWLRAFFFEPDSRGFHPTAPTREGDGSEEQPPRQHALG
jgi:hypothetical protein